MKEKDGEGECLGQEEPVEVPITGELDLHTFQPKEIPALLEDYVAECYRRKIFHLRIIHGKGTGTLRELVHKKLKASPWVKSYRLGNEQSGSWGATEVILQSAGDQ